MASNFHGVLIFVVDLIWQSQKFLPTKINACSDVTCEWIDNGHGQKNIMAAWPTVLNVSKQHSLLSSG